MRHMPWIRLDDQIAHHPKFTAAGAVASWLWVCGQSYCARYLTDGFIPSSVLPTLGNVPTPAKHAGMLVSVGLWDKAPGGYHVHDYHVYQPTKEEVTQRRDERREAGRRGGIKGAAKRWGDKKPDDQSHEQQLINSSSSRVITRDKLINDPVPVPVPKTPPESSAREGAGADFWERWRALFAATQHGATVPNLEPRQREVPDVVWLTEAYPDPEYLARMVEFFFRLGGNPKHELHGKVLSIGLFRYWATRLDTELRQNGRGPAMTVAS
jgi:hypothetical protein